MSKSGIKIVEDYAEITLSAKIYSREVLFAVGYVFLDKVYILLDSRDSDIIAYIYAKQESSDLKQLSLEFCNELLNYAHYFSRAEKNAEAIKMVLQRALFSAAPSLVKEAEEREIEDLIRELEEEEENENPVSFEEK